VQLPPNVREAIEARAEAVGFSALKRAAAALSGAYREGRGAPHMGPGERTAAYLVTRMGATYAAACAVVAETAPMMDGREIASVLDIGAGSGAASLAVRRFFAEARVTLMERDAALAEAGRDWLPDAKWMACDAARAESFPPNDLVIASYSLGEMAPAGGTALALRMWRAARQAMIIIEPGTPQRFAWLLEIRAALLDAGAHIVSPCPAPSACPKEAPDWCHFAARVERSSLHRRVKEGALGYEDEKFSYLAVAREPVTPPATRIVARPQHYPGLIVLETCTPAGLVSERVSKREKERFRAARKAEWGDGWRTRG